jgi:hypothetical protein
VAQHRGEAKRAKRPHRCAALTTIRENLKKSRQGRARDSSPGGLSLHYSLMPEGTWQDMTLLGVALRLRQLRICRSLRKQQFTQLLQTRDRCVKRASESYQSRRRRAVLPEGADTALLGVEAYRSQVPKPDGYATRTGKREWSILKRGTAARMRYVMQLKSLGRVTRGALGVKNTMFFFNPVAEVTYVRSTISV